MCLLCTFHCGKHQTYKKWNQQYSEPHCQQFSWLILIYLLLLSLSSHPRLPKLFLGKFQVEIVLYHWISFQPLSSELLSQGSHLIIPISGMFHIISLTIFALLCSTAPLLPHLGLFLSCFMCINHFFLLLFTPQPNLHVLIYFGLIPLFSLPLSYKLVKRRHLVLLTGSKIIPT